MRAGSTGLVFDVQRFSVHDGPGIRTTVFFKGCPLRCRWCQNPESLRPAAEIAFEATLCRERFGCLASCPRDAVSRAPDRIVRSRCDGCGRCVDACAFGALRLVGRTVDVDGLCAELLRDRPFYAASGGGVTMSGGEPTLQLDFVAACAAVLRDHGVGVALQTCGAFAFERFAPHLPLFELIQYDLKLIDADEHRRHTGADNGAILANARRLVDAGAPVRFRMPVVPGITDTDANLAAVARLLGALGVPRIQLLGYHRMGEAKAARVGYPIPPLRLRADGDFVARAAARLRASALEVII